MQVVSRVLLLALVLWLPGMGPALAQGPDYRVYLLGEEVNLTLRQEGGRVYALQTELINLAAKLQPGQRLSRSDERSWLPLRDFWEELGLKVKWIPGIQAIIISNRGDDQVIPEQASKIIAEALADTLWLSLSSKEELARHLSQYYTQALVEEVLDDTWLFVEGETDWHSVYRLTESLRLDGGQDWLLVQVTVQETFSPGEEPVYFHGVIKLQHLDEGWRIAAQQYFDEI
ncbi:MAG TPA: hypothetical protein GXX34_02720 [Clostridia bacterium]|nr:hypothetical protein [Clostridia bacterium]